MKRNRTIVEERQLAEAEAAYRFWCRQEGRLTPDEWRQKQAAAAAVRALEQLDPWTPNRQQQEV